MRRFIAGHPEVPHTTDKALTEMMFPHTVHEDPSGQRMVRLCEPIGEGESTSGGYRPFIRRCDGEGLAVTHQHRGRAR